MDTVPLSMQGKMTVSLQSGPLILLLDMFNQFCFLENQLNSFLEYGFRMIQNSVQKIVGIDRYRFLMDETDTDIWTAFQANVSRYFLPNDLTLSSDVHQRLVKNLTQQSPFNTKRFSSGLSIDGILALIDESVRNK